MARGLRIVSSVRSGPTGADAISPIGTPVVGTTKYPVELRERAVALYLHSRPRITIKRLADQLDVHPEALRYWIRRAEREAPPVERVVTAETDERDRLRRENAELRRAIEALKAANNVLAEQTDPNTLRA
jgi:transposase